MGVLQVALLVSGITPEELLDVFHDTGVFEGSPLPRSGSLVPFAMASRASTSRTVVVQVLVAFSLQPWSTAPATGPVGRLGRPSASDPWGIGSFLSLSRPTCVRCPGLLGSCSPVCPRGLLWCVCGVLGRLAPVHRCARSMCCVACAVSWATGLLFTGVRAVCGARVPWCVVSLFLPP